MTKCTKESSDETVEMAEAWINVTPEMIEVGYEAWAEFAPEFEWEVKDALAAAFRAMNGARNRSAS
jgi:hypothetical protein